ncbi:MAG: energy transducer TonB [Thermoanaerobaculia bacterium]|nr:energy transducer TonB [Thermoanaerobaculia bacterium]
MRHSLTSRLLVGVALGVGLLLAAGPAAAFTPEEWKAEYDQVEHHLRAADWQAADAAISKLYKATIEQHGDTGRFDGGLVQLTAMRAIAEQGLGRTDDARWHWHVAVSFLPDLQRMDLSPYGEPARALQVQGVRGRELAAGERYRKDGPVSELAGIKAPKRSKGPGIRLPSLRMKDMGGFYVFEVMVEADGTVTQPLLLQKKGSVALGLLAFDSLRGWRFKPATRDGAPVAVPYLVGVGTGGIGGGDLDEEPEAPPSDQGT